jgi:thiamine biosynthesis lipoprotein
MTPACDSVRRARPLLGTFVEISASGGRSGDLHAAISRAFDTVADVHRLMSFHDRDSDVSRLNREAAMGPVTVHPWTYEVLRGSAELHDASGGLFDVAVADTLQSLGLLPGGDGGPSRLRCLAPRPASVALLARDRVRFTNPGVRIDLGGIAKGFAVDRAVDTLQALGVPRGLVNAGGDIAAFGTEPFAVHIRDPRDTGRILAEVELCHEAIASSGAAFDRPAGAPRMAIVDPSTGRLARTIAGATVRASRCLLADALTKLVVVAGRSADALLTRYGASALLVPWRGDVLVTQSWGKELRPAS